MNLADDVPEIDVRKVMLFCFFGNPSDHKNIPSSIVATNLPNFPFIVQFFVTLVTHFLLMKPYNKYKYIK
jgi:hypothetical protein